MLELFAPKFEPGLDEEVDETNVENPRLTANIFSRWSFGYVTPLLKKGAKEYITDKDLPSLLKHDQAAELGQRLNAALTKRYLFSLTLCASVDRRPQEVPVLGTCYCIRTTFRVCVVSQDRA